MIPATYVCLERSEPLDSPKLPAVFLVYALVGQGFWLDSGLPGSLAIFVPVVVVAVLCLFSLFFPLSHMFKGRECRGCMEMVAVASVRRILAGTCLLINHLVFVFAFNTK